VINSVLVCAPLVWVFARFGAALRGNESLTNWINRSCGALFVAVGVKLAFTEKPA
jgi:threonine/homoserine/homoserine lactone efflux protein